MVILGVMADTDLLVRKGARRTDAKFFYIVPLSGMMIFARLIFFTFRARTNPPAHKHLILVGTMALVVAAIARSPFPIVHSVSAAYRFLHLPDPAGRLRLVVHPNNSCATLWAGAFLIFVNR
jgi:hypothetical protein